MVPSSASTAFLVPCTALILHVCSIDALCSNHRELACIDTPPVPLEAQFKLEQSPILFLGEGTLTEDTNFCSIEARVQLWHWQQKFCDASA